MVCINFPMIIWAIYGHPKHRNWLPKIISVRQIKKIIAKTTALFPEVNQFDVNQRLGSWDTINTKHFVDNGLFDRLYVSAQRADKVNK